MSARTELHAAANGKPTHTTLCAGLTEALGLRGTADVTGAHIFGSGPSARVRIELSTGARLNFDRYGDISKPQALGQYVVTQTGLAVAFKGVDAIQIAAAVYNLAKHHDQDAEETAACEYGSEYLRLAPSADVDMSDQADRWRAFSDMAQRAPASVAADERSSEALARAGLVIFDVATEGRYVRVSWFHSYVRREIGGVYSPKTLGSQMQSVGWIRKDRVKATSPSTPETLQWAFFFVPVDWVG